MWSEACRTREYSSICNLVVTFYKVMAKCLCVQEIAERSCSTIDQSSSESRSSGAARHTGPARPRASRGARGAMVMNVCGVRGSEHAYIATKWCSVMNLATKCAEMSRYVRRSYMIKPM